jgi:hypothetical protein
MTLDQAIALIQKQPQHIDAGKKKSSIYNLLLNVLNNLAQREFNATEIKLIERQLDGLKELDQGSMKKKHLRKFYNRFTAFLRKEFNLVTPNYYTTLTMVFGMTLGSGIGLALGTALKGGTGTAIGMSLGTGVGMVIGIGIGASKDAQAKKDGRVLA